MPKNCLDEKDMNFVHNYFGKKETYKDSFQSYLGSNKEQLLSKCKNADLEKIFGWYIDSNITVIRKDASHKLSSHLVWKEGMRVVRRKSNKSKNEIIMLNMYDNYKEKFGQELLDVYAEYEDTYNEAGALYANPCENIYRMMYMFRYFEYIERKYFMSSIQKMMAGEVRRLDTLIDANSAWKTKRLELKNRLKDDGFRVNYSGIANLELV